MSKNSFKRTKKSSLFEWKSLPYGASPDEQAGQGTEKHTMHGKRAVLGMAWRGDPYNEHKGEPKNRIIKQNTTLGEICNVRRKEPEIAFPHG